MILLLLPQKLHCYNVLLALPQNYIVVTFCFYSHRNYAVVRFCFYSYRTTLLQGFASTPSELHCCKVFISTPTEPHCCKVLLLLPQNYIARFGHGSAKLARQAQSKEKTLKKMVDGGLTEKVTTDKVISPFVFVLFNTLPLLIPPVRDMVRDLGQHCAAYQNIPQVPLHWPGGTDVLTMWPIGAGFKGGTAAAAGRKEGSVYACPSLAALRNEGEDSLNRCSGFQGWKSSDVHRNLSWWHSFLTGH